MERLTARQYAKKHKISIYNAIKLARTGQVKSETVEENGKEVLYILEDYAKSGPADDEVTTPQTPEEEIALLRARIKKLEEELALCRKERR
ncbi:MAG TPA: hypothetical protein ENK93_01100 [Campylobacteraceae bacterium]|nr:hypothetical protein [Campylobacteraceae bacterium]